MKCTVPEISWHNRDPVYTIDIQPKTNKKEDFYRLASGGTDSHIGIWYVRFENKENNQSGVCIEFASDLQRHQKPVNVVRFSPNGEILASGDDEAVIILWKLKGEQDNSDIPPLNKEENQDKETWMSFKTLRCHIEDIYDLCWSSDGTGIISGSIDNTAVVWDVQKGRSVGTVGEHKGFVQGVAWDPKNKYLATLCADRTFRVFNAETKKLVAKVFRTKKTGVQNSEAKTEKEDKGIRLYHDDTLKTFFRRLCFTPDGELIITPCGLVEDPDNEGKMLDATYIYTRASLNKPVVCLPSPSQYMVCVRCCPILFKLRDGADKLFALPYRMVFAVATKSTVVLYDTQQLEPFGFVSNIHYTGLTDLTWSPDGRLLIVSSSEGYCSIITFEVDELGPAYQADPPSVQNVTPEKQKSAQQTEEAVFKSPLKTVRSLHKTPEKCDYKTPERCSGNESDGWSVSSELSLVIDGDEEDLISKVEQAKRLLSCSPSSRKKELETSPISKSKEQVSSPSTNKRGRRVEFITISSPKTKK